jgi:hypothetical protein
LFADFLEVADEHGAAIVLSTHVLAVRGVHDSFTRGMALTRISAELSKASSMKNIFSSVAAKRMAN